jgi:hypothetical protein
MAASKYDFGSAKIWLYVLINEKRADFYGSAPIFSGKLRRF